MLIKFFLLNFILISLSINNVLGKQYILKWFNNSEVLDFLEFNDKYKYQITLDEESWEDSEENYGFLKCLGPIMISPEGKIEVEVFCKGYNHLENNFYLKLIRKSDYDV